MIHTSSTNLPTEPAVAPATGPERARALYAQQIDMLTRMAEIELGVAEAVQRRAEALADPETEGGGPGDPAMAISRVARAFRLTLALQAKFSKELLALEEGAPVAERPRVTAVPDPILDPGAERLNGRRERIDRIVRRVIEDDQGDEDEIERLSSACWERLTDEDIYGDILARPIGEMVGRICEDLEIPVNWVRLAREAWAVEEAESGAVGSPFVKPEATAGSP